MREWEEKEDKKGKRGMGRKKQTEACIGKNWEEEPDRTFPQFLKLKIRWFRRILWSSETLILVFVKQSVGRKMWKTRKWVRNSSSLKGVRGDLNTREKESDQAFWNFRTPKIDDRRRLWSRKLSTLMLENGEMFGRARKEETFFIFAKRLPVSPKLEFGFSWEKEEEKKRKKNDPTELLRI